MLDRAEIPERIVDARTPRELPSILGADEVARFLSPLGLSIGDEGSMAHQAGQRPHAAP
jgi:hypothetical protein